VKIKLLIILILIVGYTYPSGAQDHSSWGRSIYSSRISTYKLHKKTHLHKGIKQENKLVEQATSTYTATPPIPDSIKKDKLVPEKATSTITTGTPTLRPWLGESLYKRQFYNKNEEGYKKQYYPFSEKEIPSDYYSNIFYPKKEEVQPGLEKEVINPFLRK